MVGGRKGGCNITGWRGGVFVIVMVGRAHCVGDGDLVGG